MPSARRNLCGIFFAPKARQYAINILLPLTYMCTCASIAEVRSKTCKGGGDDNLSVFNKAEPLENEFHEGKLFYHAERMEIEVFGNRIVQHNRTIGFDSVDRWEKIRRLQKSKRTRRIWFFVVNKGDEGEEFLERNMGHARCLLCGFDD